MNVSVGIFGLWVGFILLVLSYFFRKKKSGKTMLLISEASFFISLIAFLWWGIARNF